MDGYLDSGRTLVTDNWCTSLKLAETLLLRKPHLVNTLSRNRKGIPDSIFNIELGNADGSDLQCKHKKLLKLQKAEAIAMRNKKGITVIHFKNKRNVLLMILVLIFTIDTKFLLISPIRWYHIVTYYENR